MADGGDVAGKVSTIADMEREISSVSNASPTRKITLSKDIFTAIIALLVDPKRWQKLTCAERFSLIFLAFAAAILQILSVVLLYLAAQETEQQNNVLLNGNRTTLTTYLSQSKDLKIILGRVVAIVATLLYLGRLLADIVALGMLVGTHKNKPMRLTIMVVSFYNAAILYSVVIALIGVLSVQDSITDIFGVALGFFFILEIDDWAYKFIQGTIDGLTDEIFQFECPETLAKRKWGTYVNQSFMLTFGYMLCMISGSFMVILKHNPTLNWITWTACLASCGYLVFLVTRSFLYYPD